jgi:hypothetical protein
MFRMAAVGVQRGDEDARLFDADSTTAPAPSPNSTQVVRSLKSRMRENVSAPTTSAVRCWPLRMKLSAIASA